MKFSTSGKAVFISSKESCLATPEPSRISPYAILETASGEQQVFRSDERFSLPKPTEPQAAGLAALAGSLQDN